MRGGRRTKQWWWRWRSNPLRRRDDVLEAWLVLAAWVLVVVGGTFAGAVAARAADETFARQRADRTPVRAVLLADVPRTTGARGNVYSDRAMAKVRWTAADGSRRTGSTLVDAGLRTGSTVTVWTNRQGDLTSRPPGPTDAAVEAGFLGAGAALALSGLVIGAGAAARCRLDRRRIAQWGREWDMVGPRWGHKTG
ncbi:hypothetical protein DI272_03520 [Streptomyces sp. Act143]|uniref:Rv1733c family protein n=1 Tax=Streptomyces sp. Act143 TaxID=2200760 RepID=UPI000D67863A|nr:hypothetical protein [Streptomyces sp. Act143]PWI13303.1 hypothetical protein DI272_03520 [Streptomyces sp. Act143]